MHAESYRFDIYISACPEDADWAEGWLRPRLEAAGLRVGTEADFDIGVARIVNVERAVIGSRNTLLILTPAWIKSGWAEFESVLTQTRDIDDQAPQTLPLLLEPCQPPLRIAALTYADFTEAQRREAKLQQVIAAARGEHNLKVVGATLSQFLDNRGRMLQKVQSFWVEGVLESGLQGLAPLDLNLSTQPDAIPNAWDAVVQQAQAAEPIPQGTSVGELFDRYEGALLILAEPGGGKTTLLLQLARDLLARAEWNPGFLMPVVFNLSSWSKARQPLSEWLIEELNSRYDVPQKLGRAWVSEDQLIPLLDGLDEVDAADRPACVEAINAFRQERGFVRLAVCCRQAEYQLLPLKLKLRGALLVQPLTSEQVDEYLARAGESLAGLREAVQQDTGLRDLAQTPLMLGIMLGAYRGVPAALLLAQSATDDQQQRLFGAYVERMFTRRGASPQYSREQTVSWLAWLARGMRRQGQSIFLIERLQPEWLASYTTLRQYVLIDRLAGGLLIGLAGGLVTAILLAIATWSSVDNHMSVLLGGLSTMLLGGSISGLFGGRAAPFERGQRTIWQIAANALIGWLGIGIISGMYHGMIFGPTRGLADGLVTGLAGALAGALMGNPGLRARHISVVETLRWSSTIGFRLALAGLLGGFIIGMVYGLIYSAAGKLAGDFPIWLSYGLTGGLIIGIAGGLIGGLTGDQLQTTVIPNQGIWRSMQSALCAGLVYGLASGLIVGVIYGLFGGPQILLHTLVLPAVSGGLIANAPAGVIAQLSGGYVSGVAYGLIYGGLYGLIVALIAALSYGGYAVLSHFALRIILWRQDAMPWNYAAFLDYAAGRVFLRKVGGGYIFVHRMLLEYFAALPDAAAEPISAAKAPQRAAERTAIK